MNIVKSCALGAVIAALSVVPALAQSHRGKGRTQTDTQSTTEKKAKDAQAEKDYKAALDRIPDQKPGDPWGSVRSTADKAKTAR